MSRLRERRGIEVNLRSEPQMLEYTAIAARIAEDRPRKVLDWGCGWGQVAMLLHDHGLDVTALDYRPDRELGVEPLPRFPEIEAYLTPEPVELPFENDSFDAVLSLGVLEHVADPDGSLEEIKRVLEPRGAFYVYKLPNRYSYLERLARLMGLYYHGANPDDLVYDKRSATALLGRHGFQIKEFRRTNMLPLTLEGRAATRAAPAIWTANRALAKVPALNLLATNLELVAISPA